MILHWRIRTGSDWWFWKFSWIRTGSDSISSDQDWTRTETFHSRDGTGQHFCSPARPEVTRNRPDCLY